MAILSKANTSPQVAEFSEEATRVLTLNEEGWDTRAYDLMELLLLDQYANSVNLKLYMKAYMAELDTLMFQTREVYLGRMLEFSVGVQLDIIGEILQQSRSIIVNDDHNIWFGFVGATDPSIPYPMGADGVPAPEGSPYGRFYRDNHKQSNFEPLSDEEYRRILLARGYVCNNRTKDINTTYKVIHLLLGRVPAYIKLLVPNPREVVLELLSSATSSIERDIIATLSYWYIPMGISFTVTLI